MKLLLKNNETFIYYRESFNKVKSQTQNFSSSKKMAYRRKSILGVSDATNSVTANFALLGRSAHISGSQPVFPGDVVLATVAAKPTGYALQITGYVQCDTWTDRVAIDAWVAPDGYHYFGIQQFSQELLLQYTTDNGMTVSLARSAVPISYSLTLTTRDNKISVLSVPGRTVVWLP